MITSPKQKLNEVDWKKIAKGFGIASVGFLVTYLLQVIPLIDFGDKEWIAQISLMVLANISLKYFSGPTK